MTRESDGPYSITRVDRITEASFPVELVIGTEVDARRQADKAYARNEHKGPFDDVFVVKDGNDNIVHSTAPAV